MTSLIREAAMRTGPNMTLSFREIAESLDQKMQTEPRNGRDIPLHVPDLLFTVVDDLLKREISKVPPDVLKELSPAEKRIRKLFAILKLIRVESTKDDQTVVSANWHERNINNWRQWLSPFKGRAINALEIGSYEGASALWQMENILTNKQARLTCVDTWQGSDEHKKYAWDCFDMNAYTEKFFDHNLRPFVDSGRVIKKRGTSMEILQQLKTEQEKFDFIYVDGSHHADDVYRDGVAAFELLNPGGIIIFDDYDESFYDNPEHNPKAAVDRFVREFSSKLTILGSGRQYCIKKTT